MKKYHSKLAQQATYIRVYEGDRRLQGAEVISVIHGLQAEVEQQTQRAEKAEGNLAKANKRVKYLEDINRIYDECPELTFDIAKKLLADDINKFALERKIEALESFVLPYKQEITKEYVKGGYGSLVLKAAQAEIEQLRKEQENG